MLKILTKAC